MFVCRWRLGTFISFLYVCTIRERNWKKTFVKEAVSLCKQGDLTQASSELIFIFHSVINFFPHLSVYILSLFLTPYLFLSEFFCLFFVCFFFWWVEKVRGQCSYFFVARSHFQIQYWVILRESWQRMEVFSALNDQLFIKLKSSHRIRCFLECERRASFELYTVNKYMTWFS